MREEARSGLPHGLLQAIGRVESGRRDPDGLVEAWPWSINAAGQGFFAPSAEAAIAKVAALQASGVRSIDVGCFQVNLLHHPDAFASLAEAFDPAANARVAARILLAGQQGGHWEMAVARYHSATPEFGFPYAQAVYASWAAGPAMPGLAISRVEAAVRVIVPGSPIGRTAGLPVVITPSR